MKSTTLSTRRWEYAKQWFRLEKEKVEQWTGRPLTEQQRKEVWKWAYLRAAEGPCHT